MGKKNKEKKTSDVHYGYEARDDVKNACYKNPLNDGIFNLVDRVTDQFCSNNKIGIEQTNPLDPYVLEQMTAKNMVNYVYKDVPVVHGMATATIYKQMAENVCDFRVQYLMRSLGVLIGSEIIDSMYAAAAMMNDDVRYQRFQMVVSDAVAEDPTLGLCSYQVNGSIYDLMRVINTAHRCGVEINGDYGVQTAANAVEAMIMYTIRETLMARVANKLFKIYKVEIAVDEGNPNYPAVEFDSDAVDVYAAWYMMFTNFLNQYLQEESTQGFIRNIIINIKNYFEAVDLAVYPVAEKEKIMHKEVMAAGRNQRKMELHTAELQPSPEVTIMEMPPAPEPIKQYTAPVMPNSGVAKQTLTRDDILKMSGDMLNMGF